VKTLDELVFSIFSQVALTKNEISEAIENKILPIEIQNNSNINCNGIKRLFSTGYRYGENYYSTKFTLTVFYLIIEHGCDNPNWKNEYYIVPLEKVEYILFDRDNEVTYTKPKEIKRDQVKGAIVGAAIAGSTGAVIGAAANSGTKTVGGGYCHHYAYNLKIKLKNIYNVYEYKKYHEAYTQTSINNTNDKAKKTEEISSFLIERANQKLDLSKKQEIILKTVEKNKKGCYVATNVLVLMIAQKFGP